MLLCAILNEEIRNKRTNWFGHVAVENSKGEVSTFLHALTGLHLSLGAEVSLSLFLPRTWGRLNRPNRISPTTRRRTLLSRKRRRRPRRERSGFDLDLRRWSSKTPLRRKLNRRSTKLSGRLSFPLVFSRRVSLIDVPSSLIVRS